MKTGKLQNHGNVDAAFIECGFCNWKDTSGDKGVFSSHERSSCHKKAIEVVVRLAHQKMPLHAISEHAIVKNFLGACPTPP